MQVVGRERTSARPTLASASSMLAWVRTSASPGGRELKTRHASSICRFRPSASIRRCPASACFGERADACLGEAIPSKVNLAMDSAGARVASTTRTSFRAVGAISKCLVGRVPVKLEQGGHNCMDECGSARPASGPARIIVAMLASESGPRSFRADLGSLRTKKLRVCKAQCFRFVSCGSGRKDFFQFTFPPSNRPS